jgi:glucan phosphoethanolaminetransferase (alkaline phosphatase superfamily)
MFKTLYELLVGQNTNPAYASDVFPTVGLFTLAFAGIAAILFYLLLGRWRPIWHKTVHWLVTILILAAAAGYIAVSVAKKATEEDADSYMYTFSLINVLYVIVYFIILSLLLKKASIFAKRTPF